MIKRLTFFTCLISLLVVLGACGKEEVEQGEKDIAIVDYSTEVTENPIVTITMENDEKIVLELQPKTAPNTVANFISLVEDGFYDGLIFHRVIEGFMIQGGDPEGTGMGGPGYSIEGEFTSNGFKNNLKHERGVISMARTGDPNSAGSQFFIMHKDASSLDDQYAAFGKVIEGIEVVDKIATAKIGASDKPTVDQVMKKVEVDTKGYNYPDPIKQ